MEQQLFALGFSQDTSGASPVCRWFRLGIVVDVMPNDPTILGFSNRWYDAAFRSAKLHSLGEGASIRVVSAACFLATKLEAFAHRGQDDFQASRDLEDIVAVLDGRETIVEEVRAADETVRHFLRERFSWLLGRDPFVVSIVGHLAGDSARASIVLERIEAIIRGGDE